MNRNIKLKPEDLLHKAYCDYLEIQYPGVKIHHSPNEGKRGWFQRYLMTILRVSPGFPDLFICYKGKAIAPELKATKMVFLKRLNKHAIRPTSTASPQQLEWVQTLNGCNIPSRVCIGIDEAMKFTDEHFLPLKRL